MWPSSPATSNPQTPPIPPTPEPPSILDYGRRPPPTDVIYPLLCVHCGCTNMARATADGHREQLCARCRRWTYHTAPEQSLRSWANLMFYDAQQLRDAPAGAATGVRARGGSVLEPGHAGTP